MLASVAVGTGLVVIGIGLLNSTPPEPPPENGQGGPSEMLVGSLPPSPAGDVDLSREPGAPGSAQAWLADFQEDGLLARGLPTAQLGPLNRDEPGRVEMVIGKRETFYDALSARGVPHGDIMALVKACKPFRNLTKVKSGDVFRIQLDSDGGLRALGFDLDLESHVTWVRSGDSYDRVDGTYPVERRTRGVAGTIQLSLYASLLELDAPLALAAKMNDIMGWDIDFKRDLRKGDTFRIIYEEVWKDGELVRTGAVEALEIVNRGRTRRAYRFSTADGRPGYFDDEGKNLQKQLMRAPLEYSRISSDFSYRRFHPVLKKWMPHLGVDYAAPLGTPIRAGGDGVVVAATVKKGNGRYVHIRHNNSEYETYYLHLANFAKGIKAGAKVRQGEVIGYVGATGYATGPHLDYRVKRNGEFVNPRLLKLPAAHPVSGDMMADFHELTGRYSRLLAELDLGSTADLALAAPVGGSTGPGELLASRQLPQWVRAAP
ncbi:peptidoglycan DD-metalloendopeptidase family protein [bacterium]|nr:peptidoglycan DD-metalloendopeptidase family protein [bacterium]